MAQTHINAAFAGNRDDLNSQTLGYLNSFVKEKKCCIVHYITPCFNLNIKWELTISSWYVPGETENTKTSGRTV